MKKKILESAAAERRLLKAYFIQEGLGGGKMSSATVDVGWVGSSRLIMNRILEREGMSGCYGFYFGCSVDMLPPKYGDYMCYYGSSLLKACPPGLFEHYFSSASHPTSGMRKSPERFILYSGLVPVPEKSGRQRCGQKLSGLWPGMSSREAWAVSVRKRCGSGEALISISTIISGAGWTIPSLWSLTLSRICRIPTVLYAGCLSVRYSGFSGKDMSAMSFSRA